MNHKTSAYDQNKTASHRTTKVGGYRWYYMGERPLAYPVMNGKSVAIPAGTTHVGIAFNQSHLTRVDESGKTSRLNVYRVRVRNAEGKFETKVYHA